MLTKFAVRLLPLCAWTCLAFIAYATLTPIAMRPVVAGVQTEHIAAYAVLALLFGLAYPRHLLPVIVLVCGAAVLMEIAQHFIPGRHGRILDVGQKWGGSIVGLGLAAVINIAASRSRP